VLACSLW